MLMLNVGGHYNASNCDFWRMFPVPLKDGDDDDEDEDDDDDHDGVFDKDGDYDSYYEDEVDGGSQKRS